MTSPGQPQPPDASGREERLDDVGPAENRRLCYGTSSFMSRAVSSVTFSKHCGRHRAISRRARSHEVYDHLAARHEDDEAFAQICNGKIENILSECPAIRLRPPEVRIADVHHHVISPRITPDEPPEVVNTEAD